MHDDLMFHQVGKAFADAGINLFLGDVGVGTDTGLLFDKAGLWGLKASVIWRSTW